MRLFSIMIRTSTRWRISIIGSLLGLLILSCRSPQPVGPLFTPANPPGPAGTLLYVYRTDSLRGVGRVDISLDGAQLGQLRDGEYFALHLAPGPHSIDLSLKLGGLIPRGWNQIQYLARAGATDYFRIWAATEAPARVDGMESSPPGRWESSAGVNVFAGLWSGARARPELERCFRAVRIPSSR